MTTKYAVYDPTTGENKFYDTKDEALQNFWVTVISHAKSYFHGTAYTTVIFNDDGSQTWKNDNDEDIEKPKTPKEIEELISKTI